MDVGDVIPDKLFVGGLASETDEKTLEDTFSKYGRIKETYIIRAKDSGMSKGYGFITFVNSDDCADAVKSMDGKDLGGNPIHVEQATVRPRINNFRPASGGFRDGPPRGRRPPLLSMARDRLENAKRTLGRLPPRSPVGGMRGRGRGFSSGLSRGAPPFRDGPPPPRGGLLSPPGRPSFMSRDGPPPSYDRDGPPMSRSSRYSRDGPPPPSSSYRSPPRSSMRGMDMSRDSGPPSSRGGFSQSRSGMGPPPRYDGDNSRDRGGMSMRNSRGGGGGMMSRDRGMSPPPQRNYRDSYTTNDSRTLDYAQSDRYNSSRDMGSSRGLMSRSTDDYGMGRTSSRDYLQTSRDNYPMSSRSEFGRDSGYGRRSPIMSSHSSNTRESDMYNDRGHDSAPSRGLSSSFSSRVLVPMNSRQSYGTPPRIGPSRFTTPRSQQRGGSPSPRYNGPPSRGQPLSSDGTSMSSRGPPMSSRGPLMSSRGPPMSSRAPPMSSRGPPRSSSRSSPPSSTRGPPSSTRGPPMSSRGPPPRDGGSRRDTSSNGPPPRDMADRRGPPSSRSHRRSSPTASRGGPPPKRSRMDPPPSRSSKGSTRR